MNSVIAQIQQWIVANGNKEITANVLRPILISMVEQANENIGDLSQLGTTNTNTLVDAINEILNSQSTGEGVTIHTGTNNPNTTPPATFGVTDYYLQTSGGATVALWQFNDLEWVKIEKLNVKASSLFIPIQDWSANLEDQVRDYINSVGVTVSSEILYLYGLKPLQHDSLAFQKYVWAWTLGNGTFNAGNPITSEDLFYLSNTFNNTSTEIIDLGEIQANTIESIVNISGPFALTYGNANAFKVTRSGVETFYLYFGNEELVGLNEYQTNADEYIEINNFEPTTDVTQKLDRGGYAGSAQDLDDRISALENEPQIIERYPDFLSFPAEGFEDTLYIDELENQAYLWDDFEGLYFSFGGSGYELTAQAITDALTYTPLRGVKTSDGEEVPVVGGFAELPEFATQGGEPQVSYEFDYDAAAVIANPNRIFPVPDSAKLTDVYGNGSKYRKNVEWEVHSPTEFRVIIGLVEGDFIEAVASTMIAPGTEQDKTDVISYAISSPSADLTAGDTDSFNAPYDFTLNGYFIAVNEAPTGSSLVVGLKKNTVSVTSSGAIIDTNETTSLTGTAPTITTSSFLQGDKITPSIIQAGAINTGKSLKIYLQITKL